MSKRIDRIHNYRYPVSQPTVFDEQELTVLELVSKVAYKINETVGEVNSWIDYLDVFVKAFDKKLQTTVTETLTEWQDSGLLDVIIDEALQTQMDVLEDETHMKLEVFEGQLVESETDIEERGFNIKRNTHLVVGNDWTQAINQAITDHNVIIIPEGTFQYSGTLVIPPSKHVRGTNKSSSIITFTNTTEDCIRINKRSQLSDLQISVVETFSAQVISLKNWEMIEGQKMNSLVERLHISKPKAGIGTGIAIGLESKFVQGKAEYFLSCVFRDIFVYGRWENGIYACLHHDGVNKTWINDILYENVFIDSALDAVVLDMKDISVGGNLELKDMYPFEQHIFRNVSSQYNVGFSRRYLVMKRGRRIVFDSSLAWDYYLGFANYKPYQIYAVGDNHVKLSVIEAQEPVSVIEMVQLEGTYYSQLKNFVDVTILAKVDYVVEYADAFYSKTITNPDQTNTRRSMVENKQFASSLKTISESTVYTFLGYQQSPPSGFAGSGNSYEYQFGYVPSLRTLALRHYENGEWNKFGGVLSEHYFPNGTTAKRNTFTPTAIGYMYFDTNLSKPLWWNGSIWVDATGTAV